jgi:GDP-L-fucose synthase
VVTYDSKCLDLRNQAETNHFFKSEKPEFVFFAAGKVGGIHANNNYRAEFIYDNISMVSNVINSAYKLDVSKLLFLGSSCIYPKLASQPLKEEYLLSGPLEPTNEPYAIAKIAGIKLCQAYRDQYGCDFISAMPTNLYGPNDNYDIKNSHVLPALIIKFHNAKIAGSSNVKVWGTGSPKREFLHVDDLAEACVFLMEGYSDKSIINVGTGQDISIKDLAEMIREIVGFKGNISFDSSKPDGTPRKLLDVSKINSIGWKYKTGLREGIEKVYEEIRNSEILA